MIKWGIIGAGNIAHRFAESLTHVENAELYGIACRSMEKAKEFEVHHSAKMISDDYNELINNSEIDLVYIALPHLYHYEWTMKALKKGKGVLCEKPATMSSQEMKDIINVAEETKSLYMEAMKSRFVPAYREVSRLVFSGEIGQIKKISTSLCREFDEATSSYHFLPVQGGALLDMGIYNIAFIQNFAPKHLKVSSIDYIVDENRVDRYINVKLIAGEFEAIVETGFDRLTEAVAIIEGTEGTITVPDFHRPTSFSLNKAGVEEVIEMPYQFDDFYSEIEAFQTTFSEKKRENDIMTLEDSLECAQIVELIRKEIK